ncbi:hypothetical protein A4X20_14565 [Mycolicibacterium iranicum]|uniref:DNA primase/polymerase bifunctional N-terminal domain-containing protein n=2 Tax=Mycolicibacterium iranicum TaxID=912594 RepID=A0A178M1B3_MYCIR|nr:hypothetical protein A4X20_14565 [Mycolicibacterium iranicum]
MYAKAGLHVVPVKAGTKNPGSYLGRGWPARATDDVEVVGHWWRRWPDAGIAMHVGGSGLAVIDVDVPENVPEWLWTLLERAIVRPTTTDPDSKRGHYFYRLKAGERFGCGLGRLKPPRGKRWGEVKCYGGAVVLGPTPHPREGGHYATGPGGTIPYRPDEIADKLNAPDADRAEAVTPGEFAARVKAFLETNNDNDAPLALDPICRAFDPTPSNRHSSMWDALCWAMREAKAGRFSAKQAASALRDRWTDAIGGQYRGDDPDEFDRMLRDAIAVADADGTREELLARAHGFVDLDIGRAALNGIDSWAPTIMNAPGETGRFRLVSARELGQPIKPMRWLVRGIWPERSAGVLGGDKKALKTWNLQAIALAVATGSALFDEYPVTTSGSVLYLCGEGGQDTFANRHQVIAARYGITPDALLDIPLGAEFGVAMLTDREFTEAVKRHLDELQPKLVILDPLYAYHPSDVEVQNIYQRGPMLANLRTLIGGEAALIVGDHFNKTAARGLDLDNIAQAGMAQWADSWILQKHRAAPDLDTGKFCLEVETGSRRGGGKHLEVDWTLRRDVSDPDAIMWTGVDWESRPFNGNGAAGQMDKTAEHILQVVRDNPFELTETKVVETVGGNRQKTREVLQGLKVNGWLVIRNCERKEGGRMVKRDRVGLGSAGDGFGGAGTGSEVVPDEGTGSERVES